MDAIDLLILDFQEARRRSLLVWEAIPSTHSGWRPDKDAMSFLESVRHVLESEHLYEMILHGRGNIGDYSSPWNGRPYSSVRDEVEFARPFREQFLAALRRFHPEDLRSFNIERRDKDQTTNLGKFLTKMVYHEAVHTGQLLSYFRTFDITPPHIWD